MAEKEKETKKEDKVEEKKEDKVETKEKEEKKKPVAKKKVAKKDVAFARGVSLRISPKQSVFVCRLLRGKSPEAAIDRLQAVIDEKRAVPMASLEVGHKKGKGLAGGKFPKNACRAIMDVVKQAHANSVVAGIDEPVISVAKSDKAEAPFRRGGRRAKRAHVYIEIREKAGHKVSRKKRKVRKKVKRRSKK